MKATVKKQHDGQFVVVCGDACVFCAIINEVKAQQIADAINERIEK